MISAVRLAVIVCSGGVDVCGAEMARWLISEPPFSYFAVEMELLVWRGRLVPGLFVVSGGRSRLVHASGAVLSGQWLRHSHAVSLSSADEERLRSCSKSCP